MVVKAQADAEKNGTSGPSDGGPSIAYWTPEVNALAAVIDKLSVLIEMQTTKPKQPVPYARPKTKVQRLKAARENNARWDAHKALTARVIVKPPANDG